ncbi:MAG: Tryptophan synthase alpha chain [Labilithrix sp.]|nr:Tryptophan synthase alpha chain [Labilithrix sp.]
MRFRRCHAAFVALATFGLGTGLAACGTTSSGASSGSEGSDGGTATTEGGGQAADGAGPTPGPSRGEILPDHHSPATGCATSELACGPGPSSMPLLCTEPKTDAFNCGACGKSCDIGNSCVDGACTDAGTCANGVVCNGTCVHDRYSDPNHCGSCQNRCGERELCLAYDCRSGGGGTGASCDSPLVVPPASASPNYGFHFGGALVGMHTFACGPLSPVPTRWFRVTASTSLLDLRAVTKDKADLIVEVFPAPCAADGGAAPLGCNDNTSMSDLEPRLSIPTTVGTTYLVAVGIVSGSPAWAKLDF